MYKIALTISFFFVTVGAKADKMPLLNRFTVAQLKTMLQPIERWQPFPAINDRAAWATANSKLLQQHLHNANKLLSYRWLSLPATASLAFGRKGDRDAYENISLPKRRNLGTLLLGELAENKGQFIDHIIDGVWSICEESFWGVPAHLRRGKMYNGLKAPALDTVDIFAAETAAYLAWVDFFLGEKLDSISVSIRKRIYKEVDERIFTPLETKSFFWMTMTNGRPPNNWNPWICSNWLAAILLLEKNEERRAAHVKKILVVLDEYLKHFSPDGGIDEGPVYWGASVASFYDALALLNSATNNAFRYIFQEPLVKRMGQYIYTAHIGGSYFLNFSDAFPTLNADVDLIYRYGRDVGDKAMMQFAAEFPKREDSLIHLYFFSRNLFALFLQKEKISADDLPKTKDVWYPHLQVLIAKDNVQKGKGFFLAAKGGHNDESHNHNDIGNYVVYYDGKPLIIDVGRGTYTARTFSNRRYEIWSNRSEYHNTITVNGQQQPAGRPWRATALEAKMDKKSATLSMELKEAYPVEAGITSARRSIALQRGRGVSVQTILAGADSIRVQEHLITPYQPAVATPGSIHIRLESKNGTGKIFVVRYDAKTIDPLIEKIAMNAPEDKGIRETWGENLFRITLQTKLNKKGTLAFDIVPAQ